MPEKGVDVALDAFAEIERHLPGTRLLIAGDGDERAALESRAKTLNLKGVEFLGWTPPDQIHMLLNRVTALVMPSRQDSFPLAALEAAGMQRPVIGTQVGGLPEMIVHGETGFLVPPEDPASLSRSIITLLSDLNAAQKMGKAAEKRLRRYFSWSRHVEAYDRLYRDVSLGREPDERDAEDYREMGSAGDEE
jgi:glycosyltransferase involved in cell wall biosynthesis